MNEPSCDDRDYFDSDIESISVADGSLIVEFRNLALISDDALQPIARARVTFVDVVKSVRTIYPYLNKPEDNAFGPTEVITDVDSQASRTGARTFRIEGRLLDPPAWVGGWEIIAERCDLEILECTAPSPSA